MLKALAVALIATSLGCTFYTACPNGTGSNPAGPGNPSSGGSTAVAGPTNVGGAAPTGAWVNAIGSLEGMTTGYAAVTYVASKPDEDKLIAGISERGLWSSVDGGVTWQAMGTAKGSAVIVNRPSAIAFDPDNGKVFWEAGTYGPGVFKTSDTGDTLTELGDIGDNEAIGIDFSDPERKTLVAAGHEQNRVLFLSTDGGSSWNNLGALLPGDLCTFPLVIDSSTFVITCTGTTAGLFRTSDAGQTWLPVSTAPGTQAALLASDGAIYWPVSGGVLKSRDQGQTWAQVFTGNASWARPFELPDKSVAVLTDQNIVLSSDAGVSWRAVTSQVPKSTVSMAYSSFQKAFYVWHNTIDPTIPADAIQRYDFDYTAAP